MDKEYVVLKLKERIAELKKRYNMYVNSKDENGKTLSYKTSAQYRCITKKEINTCLLLLELINTCKANVLFLTEDAINALDIIMEPCERHRRLKE